MVASERVKKAFKAMKSIGIAEDKTKPALKRLLKVFNKNWSLIEEENYRVLADAIFEYEETERGEASEVAAGLDGPMADELMPEEPERPLKRLRLKHQGQGQPSNGQSSPGPGIGGLKIPKPEPGEPMISSPRPRNITTESEPGSPQPLVRNKGKQPVSSHNTGGSREREKRAVSDRPAQALQLKEPKLEPGTALSGKQRQPQKNVLLKPKDEPFTDDVVSIEPLAVVHPECLNKEAPSNPASQGISENGERPETIDGVDNGTGSMASAQEKEKESQEVNVTNRALAKVDIATSTLGEVKIYMTCNPGSNGQEMHIPDLEAVLNKVNENCVRAYNIMEPGFSVSEVMRQFCDCVVELGKNANGAVDDSREQ
ncbi:putative inactive histone-lysine N-methyltransferase SUVR2 isoform X2 [Silene latifolia]|uniref:putative inactive histone-lysine N-methyltransferase SUVR2 isoform X2 n=1 Tax=Silene latifolia TaxID=37657 RepID=UPI003D77400B